MDGASHRGPSWLCPRRLGRFGIGLVDAERVALGVEVVALPGHAHERHLRQGDLAAGIQDAAFGLVVVADTIVQTNPFVPWFGAGAAAGPCCRPPLIPGSPSGPVTIRQYGEPVNWP